jgi:hypothetical protein
MDVFFEKFKTKLKLKNKQNQEILRMSVLVNQRGGVDLENFFISKL